jgi:hypothetical protein
MHPNLGLTIEKHKITYLWKAKNDRRNITYIVETQKLNGLRKNVINMPVNVQLGSVKTLLIINTFSISKKTPSMMVMIVMMMMMMMMIIIREVFWEVDCRSDYQGIPKEINRILSASLSHMNPVHTFPHFLSNPF